MEYCIKRMTKDFSDAWELTEEASNPSEIALKFSKLNKLERGTVLFVLENKVFSPKKFYFRITNTEPYDIESGIIKPNNDEEESSKNSFKFEEIEDADSGVQPSYKFKTLLSYGKFISGFGWIIGILGVIAIIGGLMSGEEAGFGIAIGALLLIIVGVLMVVNGQLISCFVSIEKNTRTTCELLQRGN